MAFRYVYGPVPSRRLGRSLGVNPIPYKTCNYSCVYCQLGRTLHMVNDRQDFFPPGEILEEIRQALDSQSDDTDYITFVGEGEPTLCKSLGSLITDTKRVARLPVAVITNGGLLHRDDVRKDLSKADVVMPSLDAADQDTFEKINRPHGSLKIADILSGMAEFRRIFNGKLWVEVMLVRGVNDSEGALEGIRDALDRIGPERVYVNIPIRPPAESWVQPPDPEGLVRAHAILGDAVFIDRPEAGAFGTAGFDDPIEAVLMIIRRHPMRRDQISDTLANHSPETIDAALGKLEGEGEIQQIAYRHQVYYATGEGRFAG